MRLATLLLFTVLPLSSGQADSWAKPYPRLFTGSNSAVTYGLKLLPNPQKPNAPATGELFRLTASGQTPVVWRSVLRNHPLEVYVSPRGDVITLDTYAGDSSGRHALVIYGRAGQVLADLSISEVVPGDNRIVSTASGRFLSRVFQGKFVYYDKPYFALRDARGQGPVFDLDTGKRKR